MNSINPLIHPSLQSGAGIRLNDLLDLALQPLEYLDLSGVYATYSSVIDFFVFLLVFLGAAQVTLGRKFPKRAGSAMSVGAGLALTIGMILAEETWGFNLRSFGPVAVGVLILLFAMMTFRIMHFMGFLNVTSFSVAYLALFVTLHAIEPDLFFRLIQSTPWIGRTALFLLLLALLGSMGVFRGRLCRERIDRDIRRIRVDRPERHQDRQLLSRSYQSIKRYIKPGAKREIAGEKDISSELQSIYRDLKKRRHSPQARRRILARISEIVPKGEHLLKEVQRLRALNKQLAGSDSYLISRKAGELGKAKDVQEKKLLRKEYQGEGRRLSLEKAIDRFESEIGQQVRSIYEDLKMAATHLKENKMNEATSAVAQAIDRERVSERLARQVHRLERKLLALIRREKRVEKKLDRK